MLDGLSKSVNELVTITKVHEEKHRQHEQDIEELKNGVYPVKYKK